MKLLSILSLSIMATTLSPTVFAESYTATNAAINAGTGYAKEEFSDAGITTEIKGKFAKEKLFGDGDVNAMSISVETNKGVVYLTGNADNQAQIDNANKIAHSVDGVKNVVNDVKIKNKDAK